MCIYASYVCSAGGGQRKALDPLQLEFQTVRMPLALIFLLLFVCLFVCATRQGLGGAEVQDHSYVRDKRALGQPRLESFV